jgi:hypothetical protein
MSNDYEVTSHLLYRSEGSYSLHYNTKGMYDSGGSFTIGFLPKSRKSPEITAIGFPESSLADVLAALSRVVMSDDVQTVERVEVPLIHSLSIRRVRGPVAGIEFATSMNAVVLPTALIALVPRILQSLVERFHVDCE